MKMDTFKQVMKSGVGAKLVPFFKTVAIYFVLFLPADQPSVFSAIIKALPVLSLVIFVLLHGMSLGNEHSYSRRIILGLLFSLLGDVLLVWEHLFLHGLVAFLVAQIFYVSAFGFKPRHLKIAFVCYSVMVAALSILLPEVGTPLNIGVLVYGSLLTTMLWRAIARAESMALFTSSWTKFFSCVGGVLFVISDSFLGFNHFYTPLPYSQVVIMTTYYAAQFGITLSVIDFDSSLLDVADTSRNGSINHPEVMTETELNSANNDFLLKSDHLHLLSQVNDEYSLNSDILSSGTQQNVLNNVNLENQPDFE